MFVVVGATFWGHSLPLSVVATFSSHATIPLHRCGFSGPHTICLCLLLQRPFQGCTSIFYRRSLFGLGNHFRLLARPSGHVMFCFFRRKGLWDRASHLFVVAALAGVAFRGRERFGFVARAFQCCNSPLFVILLSPGRATNSVLLAWPFGTARCLSLSQRPFWTAHCFVCHHGHSVFCPVFGTACHFSVVVAFSGCALTPFSGHGF